MFRIAFEKYNFYVKKRFVLAILEFFFFFKQKKAFEIFLSNSPAFVWHNTF
jgi:hypothetical protein